MKLAFKDEDWIGCVAHNINNLHKNSFKQLKEKFPSNSITKTIKASKDLVKHFKHSGLQTELTTKLVQAISIRWDTKFLMTDSIIRNYSEIKRISIDNKSVYELIVKIDEKVLKEITEFLKPFYELRQNLCKDLSPTIHLVMPTKYKLTSLCTESADYDSLYLVQLKRIYRNNIEKYITISNYHKMATILYPPLRDLKNLVTDLEKEFLKEKIIKAMNDLNITTEPEVIEHHSTEIDLCLHGLISSNTVSDVSESEEELNNYLQNKSNYPIGSSVLQFWDIHKEKYPRLYRMAFRLFCIPATNLSSERNFSAAKLTLTDRRSHLSPKYVNQMLFIQSNFDFCNN
jgi:hypothetical protein